MKIGYIIVLLTLLIVMLYLTFRKKSPTSTSTNIITATVSPDGTFNIPPTWNFDWQGGPGKDRYNIMAEQGPYNPGGVVYAVM